jgi:hypothetical protein
MGNEKDGDNTENPVTLSQLSIWLLIGAGTFAILDVLTYVAHHNSRSLEYAAFGAAIITTALAAAPFLRFLFKGWDVRREEILNRLNEKALYAYLWQFWEQTLAPPAKVGLADPHIDHATALKLFDKIYDGQYGRSAFITPLILVLAVTAIETVLIVFVTAGNFTTVLGDQLPALFGAICGTYMFVVGDSVMSVRRRSLNISDVYWYALRLVLAAPVGLAVGKLGGSVMAAFVLGSLPIDQFRKVLARYAGSNFTDLEAKTQDSDQLLQLEGVTGPISAQLSLEGITSIDQLIGTDPVSLAIRTGLPFKLLLRLGSQAVVRRHLGQGTNALVPLGLADAEPIVDLVAQLSTDPAKPGPAETIVKQASDNIIAYLKLLPAQPPQPAGPGPEALTAAFKLIATDHYTKFLMASAGQTNLGGSDVPPEQQVAVSDESASPPPAAPVPAPAIRQAAVVKEPEHV